MSQIFTLPSLGESVDEATVTRWLKRPGQAVREGEPLVEVSTDKVDTEVAAPATGVIERILVPEGSTVAFGAELAWIGMADVPVPPDPAPSSETGSRTASNPRLATYLTPLVRKLASELDIDVKSLSGTGSAGRIRRQDVLAAAAAAPSGYPNARSEASRDQDDATSASAWSATALGAVATDVDVTRLRDADEGAAAHLHLNAAIVQAVATALSAWPLESGAIDSRDAGSNRIGVALMTDRGWLATTLMVPADARRTELAHQLVALDQFAHRDRLETSTFGQAAATIISADADGLSSDFPPVVASRSATVAVGAVHKKPVVTTIDGHDAIAIRSYVTLVLSHDQRRTDLIRATRFLAIVKAQLEGDTISPA